jgi:hypothetical protein
MEGSRALQFLKDELDALNLAIHALERLAETQGSSTVAALPSPGTSTTLLKATCSPSVPHRLARASTR